jgi:hypothetical protein
MNCDGGMVMVESIADARRGNRADWKAADAEIRISAIQQSITYRISWGASGRHYTARAVVPTSICWSAYYWLGLDEHL